MANTPLQVRLLRQQMHVEAGTPSRSWSSRTSPATCGDQVDQMTFAIQNTPYFLSIMPCVERVAPPARALMKDHLARICVLG